MRACQGIAAPLPTGATPPIEIERVKPETGPRAPYRTASVCLEIEVGVDGSVSIVRTISSTNAVFEDVFRRSVLRWKYAPAMLDGKPVPVRLSVSGAFERAYP